MTALALSLGVGAETHEPDNTTRVLWDINSQQVIFNSGNYARIIPLADGRLMAAAESGGGISVSYSEDDGISWSSPELIVHNADRIPYAVPDLIQLSNGTILVGFNPRPSAPYSEERKFGIRVMRSTDNGASWEGPIFIFDASHTYVDGCWEPSFLEIPGTGEIQCYFANEYPYQTSGEQEISLCRSFDDGLTWSGSERVCYRAGHRDGMPSAIITDAGEIVVIIEDNGYDRGFRASTVRCSLDQNWKRFYVAASSPNRHVIFADGDTENMKWISAAPYIRKLRSGETIASWQGDHFGRPGEESKFDMFVAVGDVDARNFKQVSEPFKLDTDSHALWNSINVGNGDDIFALASIGSPTQGNAINLMKGRALCGIRADYATPLIDGSFSGGAWTYGEAGQIFLGAQNLRRRSAADFLYDSRNLYFYADVTDSDVSSGQANNDGVFIYLDLNNVCATEPQAEIFRIFLSADGSVEMSVGSNGKWVAVDAGNVQLKPVVSQSSYIIEAAIPWSSLGLQGPVAADKVMRCNVEVRDRRNRIALTEAIPLTERDASWTWPEFRLGDSGADIKEISDDSDVSVTTAPDGTISVSGPAAKLELYGLDGTLLARADGNSIKSAAIGLRILRVTLASGLSLTKKIF